jgi:hypothetical protein
MGHQYLCNLLIWGNGRYYGGKMRFVIWAWINYGDVAQAQKIGIGASMRHG